ncbi:hypothetical protein [Paenibacillus rigui]|uniref:Uncharacterized protein n=1 Tax=Paenibacillus rigui TaxID=554312 RepID=A0A229UWC1_9BACL|nr:hypothetical protein [Paenibacillus rigui]OXM87623.1 hypothetical protein CF651_03885 [Paenibacillus rigui]
MTATTLLTAEGTVTPSGSKSHITYTLHLHQDCHDLHVEFEYAPKKLEDEAESKRLIEAGLHQFNAGDNVRAYTDNWKAYLPLQNLLTISLDDETGFRGAAHRHDPVQHLVAGPDNASPGLIPGSFPRGQLRITISLHCIVTAQCRYKLHVWEGGSTS